MAKKNLYIAQSEFGGNSWHVFEYNRLNEFGERYCHLPYVTLSAADDFIKHYCHICEGDVRICGHTNNVEKNLG